MPKATCPACKAEVKYPKDAEPGSTVTCPACEEVFTPPKLKKKAYDPEDEEGYKVKRSKPNAADADKAKHAADAVKAGLERERELHEMSRGRKRKGWLEGPEVWLLVLGVGAAAGLPFGLWLARSWDKLGGVKMLFVVIVLIAVMMVAAGLAGSTWAWLRRNR